MSLANIIALVSQHNVDPTTTPDIDDSPAIVETVIGRNLPKPVRGKKQAVETGEVAAPIHSTSQAPSMALQVEVVKLDARAFFKALSKSKTRDESIAAIAGYTGLSLQAVSADFGNADREARAAAQRELRGAPVTTGPSREEIRAAHRSAAGFVAGMPAPQQRLVRDLRARAISLAESRDKATTAMERGQFQVLLDSTNAALKELGF